MSRNYRMRHTLVAVIALVLILSMGLPFAAAQDGGEEPRTLRDFVGRQLTLDPHAKTRLQDLRGRPR